MAKHRVFELAKEFGATSKVILDILARNEIQVKNHMSSVDDNGKDIIVRTFARKTDNNATATTVDKKHVPKEVKVTPKVEEVKNKLQQPEAAKEVKPPTKQVVPPVSKPEQKAPATQVQHSDAPKAPIKEVKEPFKPKQPVDNRTTTQNNTFRNNNNNNRPAYQGNQTAGQNTNRPAYQGNASAGQTNNANRPVGQQTANKPFVPKSQVQTGQAPRFNNNQNPGQQRPQGQGFTPRPNNNFPNNRPTATTGTNNPRPATDGKKPFSNQTSSFNNQRPNNNSGKFNSSNNFNKKNNKFGNKKSTQNKTNKPARTGAGAFILPTVNTEKPTHIELPVFISVKDIAVLLKREVSEVIKCLLNLGIMATINQELDYDTASLVASEFSVEVSELPPEQDPTEIPEIEDDPKKHVSRAPVVTIMGHVDHGKTSLLDTIRETNVTSREAGGITQHIGAYKVKYNNKEIVFLDTPGHEAFTSMRARGAKVTDVAILVVAADDGVMPQTIEAINHAKSAEVPIIVAINKIDKENASLDKIKQQLSEHDLLAEDWGGQTIMVPVSAHKKIGINELLEMILLVSEMQELTANPTIPAHGTIIEAQLDKGKGPVATVLIQKGTLHLGDTIIAGTAFGKVRAMVNERGESLKKAGPSTPVEVLGLSDVPLAGDLLDATDEKIARSISDKRTAKRRTEEMQQTQKVSLDDIFQQIQDGKIKELNIVVKADVQGTIEALRQSLQKIKNDEVKVVVVHSGVGAINESDVMLASASNALIIGFNVRPDANARKIADAEKVDIRMYRVIYDALNDVEAAIKGMLSPKFKEVVQGRAEVRQLITISKLIIAGCHVIEGKITRSSQLRLLRDDVVIYEGEIESLKRFKDDVKEVAAGYECGITIEKFRDIKEGDVIEAYTMEEVKAE